MFYNNWIKSTVTNGRIMHRNHKVDNAVNPSMPHQGSKITILGTLLWVDMREKRL